MILDRRQFLFRTPLAIAGIAIAAESTRRIFLPPLGGWPNTHVCPATAGPWPISVGMEGGHLLGHWPPGTQFHYLLVPGHDGILRA